VTYRIFALVFSAFSLGFACALVVVTLRS